MEFSLLRLFFIFFYIGLFAVGGGLVAATFMKQALVDTYGLVSAEKFYSMLAISESTPGPIGINMATYIGTELYGPAGGVVCTVAEVLPSLVIIMVIARFFMKFNDNPLVKGAFSTLRPATSGMILVALLPVFLMSLLNTGAYTASGNLLDLFVWKAWIFYALCLVVLFKTKLHPIVIIAAGAVFGIFIL
ncbi:MAG: chromate transporter [Treponema sp.]|nr:chromate transporter [Treponema sp.]